MVAAARLQTVLASFGVSAFSRTSRVYSPTARSWGAKAERSLPEPPGLSPPLRSCPPQSEDPGPNGREHDGRSFNGGTVRATGGKIYTQNRKHYPMPDIPVLRGWSRPAGPSETERPISQTWLTSSDREPTW